MIPPLITTQVREKDVTAFHKARKADLSQLNRLLSACPSEVHRAGAFDVAANTVDDLSGPMSSELDRVQKRRPVGVPGCPDPLQTSVTAHPTQKRLITS